MHSNGIAVLHFLLNPVSFTGLYRAYFINVLLNTFSTYMYYLFHCTLKEFHVSTTLSVPTSSGGNDDEISSTRQWMFMQKPFADFTESISESSLGTQTTVSRLMRSKTHFLPVEQSYRQLVSKTDSVPYQVKPPKLPIAPDGRSPHKNVSLPFHCPA